MNEQQNQNEITYSMLLNLRNDEPEMVAEMTKVREAANKTDYIRRLIRNDHRRHQRRAQKAQAQS